LVFEDGFGIVKKAADEGGFAVIDGASSGEAEEVHLGKVEILKGEMKRKMPEKKFHRKGAEVAKECGEEAGGWSGMGR
jgi:hypothetical protein